jgi:hypothetical protein|nr:MAG TPA: hypothetical protein [Caudoviricetes sp.]
MEINTIKEFKYKGFECYINRVGFDKGQSIREAISLTGSEDFTLRGKMTITDDYKRTVHTHGYIDSITINQYICIGGKRYHVDRTVFEYGDAGDTIRLRVEGCFLEVNCNE